MHPLILSLFRRNGTSLNENETVSAKNDTIAFVSILFELFSVTVLMKVNIVTNTKKTKYKMKARIFRTTELSPNEYSPKKFSTFKFKLKLFSIIFAMSALFQHKRQS